MFRVRRPTRSPSPLDVEVVELSFEVALGGPRAIQAETAQRGLTYDRVRLLGQSAVVHLTVLVALVGAMGLLAGIKQGSSRTDVAMSGEPTTTGSISAPDLRPTLNCGEAAAVTVDVHALSDDP